MAQPGAFVEHVDLVLRFGHVHVGGQTPTACQLHGAARGLVAAAPRRQRAKADGDAATRGSVPALAQLGQFRGRGGAGFGGNDGFAALEDGPDLGVGAAAGDPSVAPSKTQDVPQDRSRRGGGLVSASGEFFVSSLVP